MEADTKTTPPSCVGEDAAGIVTGALCTCGTAGTANPGDYCVVDSNRMIPKCTGNISACIIDGTGCPITNRGCVCDGVIAVIG